MDVISIVKNRFAKELANKSTKYWALIEWNTDKKRWVVEFGAFDRSDVYSELENYNFIASGKKKKNFKIITVMSDGSNNSVDLAVKKMNKDFPNGPVK